MTKRYNSLILGRVKGFIGAWLLAFVMLPGVASAQSDGTRAAARELGAKGVEDFEAGSYGSASDKLERAFAILRVPSLGLWSARSLVKVGKLVEASERYLVVSRLDASTGDIAVQKQAKVDAATEREALLKRIPSVTLSVEGASSDFGLTLDGTPLPPAIVGVDQPVNPGRHIVQLEYRGRVQKRELSLEEAQRVTVAFNLTRTAQSTATSSEPSQQSVGAPPPKPDVGTRSAQASGGLPTGFWVGLALVGAGVATGGVAAGLAAKKKSDLACPNDNCPPDRHDGADSYNSLLTVSTVGFVVAGVGAATAGFFMLTKPKKAVTTASLAPWVGLTSAGITGQF